QGMNLRIFHCLTMASAMLCVFRGKKPMQVAEILYPKKFMKITRIIALGMGLLSFLAPGAALAQGTAFTYSGQLEDSNGPANGVYDLTFTLFTAETGGSAVVETETNLATVVDNGQYSVVLDFGPVFDGSERWMEFGAR